MSAITKWMSVLALGAAAATTGCGSAIFYDDVYGPDLSEFAAKDEASPSWSESTSERIPPPESRGWPLRGGDPQSDEQRVACVDQIQRSRAHVSQAIETAKALGAYERLRCLSGKARELKEIRLLLAMNDADSPFDVRRDCLRAQSVVFKARACR